MESILSSFHESEPVITCGEWHFLLARICRARASIEQHHYQNLVGHLQRSHSALTREDQPDNRKPWLEVEDKERYSFVPTAVHVGARTLPMSREPTELPQERALNVCAWAPRGLLVEWLEMRNTRGVDEIRLSIAQGT